MAKSNAMRAAEVAIAAALKSNAKVLDLSPYGLSRYRGPQKIELLEDVPESLGQLKNLEDLDISFNFLSRIPDQVRRLTSLRRLNVHSNRITELPDWLGELWYLDRLDFSANPIQATPKCLTKMRSLTSVGVSGSDLTPLRDLFFDPKRIKQLSLSSRKLPLNLDDFPNVKYLSLTTEESVASLPSLSKLKSIQSLQISSSVLSDISKLIPAHSNLKNLYLYGQLSDGLTKEVGGLRHLKRLHLVASQLSDLPELIKRLGQLEELRVTQSQLTSIPGWVANLTRVESLDFRSNRIESLPRSLARMPVLQYLNLADNPLNPELSAAFADGFAAVKRYLRSKAVAEVALNEAKLILVGEGEVGKSCLLDALRGDAWIDGKPSTHGIEIKPVTLTDSKSGTVLVLNGWDFGGQRVYRPTHQLFFSAPAVYLVVWKPREGAQQGLVTEWIELIRHREPDAKILVVATHGGPSERQPDIDRQELWDVFGREMVLDFHLVDNKPSSLTLERMGISGLRNSIASVAASLPGVGRTVPKRWADATKHLRGVSAPYLKLKDVFAVCSSLGMDADEAKDFVSVSHRLGHLVHYEHDPALRDLVVLKPDWLSTALSYVLDDKKTRENNGLIDFSRLQYLWSDPSRPAESRYEPSLYLLFLRLMERFDLSYKVSVPGEPESAIDFWVRMAPVMANEGKSPFNAKYTSLVAQLVPDVRPNSDVFARAWPVTTPTGERQQVQVCRIVDTGSGKSAKAEGLFHRLIVRLHSYSLGRDDFSESIHWQRGLVLSDSYNGKALLEHVGNDVRITVRAAYPETLLAKLVAEVVYLIKSFWAGLSCSIMIPCIDPCGRGKPGSGMFELEKLVDSKIRGRDEQICPVCNDGQNIDCLLRDSSQVQSVLGQNVLSKLASGMEFVSDELKNLNSQTTQNALYLKQVHDSIVSRIDGAFSDIFQAFTDEAKDGPRIFTIRHVDPGFFDRPAWVSGKFRVTLWCEHSQLPLPALNGFQDTSGVYEISIPKEWLTRVTPYLRVLSATLSAGLAASALGGLSLQLSDAKSAFDRELEQSQKCLDSLNALSHQPNDWVIGRDSSGDVVSGFVRAQGALLRQLHGWLRAKDPGFGGLERVRNSKGEFMWVHKSFASNY